MKIRKVLRYKILFVLVPFFLISFSFLGLTIYFSSNNGITSIAKEFIGYRLYEIFQFYQEQFLQKQAFADIEVDDEQSLHKVTYQYAQKFDQEIFLIISYSNTDTYSEYIKDTNFTANDFYNLRTVISNQEHIGVQDPEKWNSWLEFNTEKGQEYVGIFIPNSDDQSWFVLLTDRAYFYKPVDTIMYYIILIVMISLAVMIVLVLFFVNFLTRPLSIIIETIKHITDTMDVSRRIKILYQDEIGFLGQYFNDMISELERSYNQIKNYAYQTVLAKKKEERIRFIFQKYVPKDVIDQVLNKSSDTMLIGTKQTVTVLFSDIRSFTTISESLNPEELVLSLNEYFTVMVSRILEQKGMIDKFIGDAIMAVFGAPLQNHYDTDRAIQASLDMLDDLELFNQSQIEKGKIAFEMGIGLNTGEAIVGNIGSEQKVDYTVIGDPVNLGARLEGLTKEYKVPILISEFTKAAVIDKDKFLFFNVDTVRVKGKVFPVKIYLPLNKKRLSQEESDFYHAFHLAQDEYYGGRFSIALTQFKKIKDFSFTHSLLDMYIQRCDYLLKNPPIDWDGVQTWKTK